MFRLFKKKKANDKSAVIDRSVAFQQIYQDIYDTLMLADMAEGTMTVMYDVYYDEDVERFFCLSLRDGVVYKIEVFPTDEGIQLGEFIKLTAQDLIPRTKANKFRTFEGENGEMRWLSIASVAVLNRIGEIDSRELFDSFIEYAERTGHFPVLNVYHLGEGSEIGQADLLARHGYVYIASGTFHNDKFGRAFYEGLQGRDDWGNSIEFWSPRAYIETFKFDGASIQVPVYKRGINTGITLVKERDAASVFTVHKGVK